MAGVRDQFNKAIQRVEKQIKKKVEMAAEAVAEGMVEGSTTVDTGLFAANWLPSINTMRESPLDHRYFGFSDADIFNRYLDGSKERIITEEDAEEQAKNIPDFKLGDTIYWTNAVPYLEENRGNFETDRVYGMQIGIDKAKARVER